MSGFKYLLFSHIFFWKTLTNLTCALFFFRWVGKTPASQGYEWFHKHESPLIRATRGLVFLREMTVQQLLAESRALRQQTVPWKTTVENHEKT